MFTRLINRDLADLNAVHSGQFVANFLYDATLMRDAITQGVAAIFLESVSLVALLAYALISDWQLGLLILVMLPSVAWAMERLGGSMRRAATRGMVETGDLAIALSEAMDGRRIVKAYGLEDHSIARVDSRLRLRCAPCSRRCGCARPPHRSATYFWAPRSLWCCSWPAGRTCMARSRSTPSPLSPVALLLALQPVRNLSQLWPTASAGIAAANRIFAPSMRGPESSTAPAQTACAGGRRRQLSAM